MSSPGHAGLIVGSKLAPVRLPDGMVRRERLLAMFSSTARVTLVSAMPGFGKTVAVRQWIETVEEPVGWVNVDLLDQDTVSFWSHVIAALRSVGAARQVSRCQEPPSPSTITRTG